MRHFLFVIAIFITVDVNCENNLIDATKLFDDRRQLDQVTNLVLDTAFDSYKEFYKTHSCSLSDNDGPPCQVRMLAVMYANTLNFGEWRYPMVNYPTLAFAPIPGTLNHGDIVIAIHSITKRNDGYDYHFVVADGDRGQSGNTTYRVKMVNGRYECHYVSSVD